MELVDKYYLPHKVHSQIHDYRSIDRHVQHDYVEKYADEDKPTDCGVLPFLCLSDDTQGWMHGSLVMDLLKTVLCCAYLLI